MANAAYANCNFSIPREDCTLQTCCVAQSHFAYIPSLAGNIFYAAFFTLALLPQLAMGVVYKTWGFMVAMIMGLILEILGYASRVWMHYSPFASTPFLV
jgi:hypothetical protein